MAGNRRRGGVFNMSYGQSGQMDRSLLGHATTQTRQQNQGGFPNYNQQQQFTNSNFNHHDVNQQRIPKQDRAYGSGQNDFGNRGGGHQQQQKYLGTGNSAWNNQSMRGSNGGLASQSDNWSPARNQGGYTDLGRPMMGGHGQGIQSHPSYNGPQSPDPQQKYLGIPQLNAGPGGILGMAPFDLIHQHQQQQQANKYGLNSDAFIQHVLTTSSPAQPQFNQMIMGASPHMGIMNQQQQRYTPTVVTGGFKGNRRHSAPIANSIQNKNIGRATVVRRSDISSSRINPSNSNNNTPRNSGSFNNSPRSMRKRRVLRNRLGVTPEPSKRPRSNFNSKSNVPKISRNGSNGKLNKQPQMKLTDNTKNGSQKVDEDQVKKEMAFKKEEDDIMIIEKESDGDKTMEVDPKESADDILIIECPKEVDGDHRIVQEKEEKIATDVSTSDETKEVTGDTPTEEPKRKSKFDQFPASFLVCKICQKVMMDGMSFETHIDGRAHVALVKILEQRFQKRTDLLKAESKLSEGQIEIELDRLRRVGKPTHGTTSTSRNRCSMCDCDYMINWAAHKASMGHRILKEFLHPTCQYCNMHFLHRMDWVHHLQSLAHLGKLLELKNQGLDMQEHESVSQDELFSVNGIEVGKNESLPPILVIRSKPVAPTQLIINENLNQTEEVKVETTLTEEVKVEATQAEGVDTTEKDVKDN